jgi:hypothetical protein
LVTLNGRLVIGLLGLAPVLFPGGIIAAGIAGAINLRRSNRSQEVPRLLIITFVLALLCAVAGYTFIMRQVVQQAPADASVKAGAISLLYVALGIVYALIIARQQRSPRQQWLELSGEARITGQDQGGWRVAFGWLSAIVLVNAVLYAAFNSFLAPGLNSLSVLYPPQHVTAEGVGLTIPAGWIEVPPNQLERTVILQAHAALLLHYK